MADLLRVLGVVALAAVFSLLISSCAELKQPQPNPFLSETQPPPMQEFRWSNGGRPKSIDPASAVAAPETDIVRALYEGLTEVDPKTLKAVPGIAEKWTSSVDKKVWTFEIRKDAKWSNGKALTATDVVRSWQRLLDLGDKTAHRNLLDNFSRVSTGDTQVDQVESEDLEKPADELSGDDNSAAADETKEPPMQTSESRRPGEVEASPRLDVVAQDQHTLIVKLDQPDGDFPNLVSHPIFRPVFGGANGVIEPKLDLSLVSNGPFKLAKVGGDSLELVRSETYWNAQDVKLDRVVFVPVSKPDEALEAYRNGEVDAVTNADFAPLAQKLFSPYADFRRSAFAALNFYEFNHTKPPFTDRRIREALSIAIEREHLSEAELDGTTKPAFSFLPFTSVSQAKIVQDKERARELFEQAGYAGGRGFPVVKLVVNRNETQQRVARVVMRMWKDALNVETQLVIKENNEIASTRSNLDFDIIRRGIVCPVANESVCIEAIDGSGQENEPDVDGVEISGPVATPMVERPNTSPGHGSGVEQQPERSVMLGAPIRSEREAIYEMRSMPLYFPISFALIKPYVLGFEMNSLDAQSLGEISIDSGWQPRQSVLER